MASRPDPTFGKLESDRPSSSWQSDGWVAVPSLDAPRTFQEGSATLTLEHLDEEAQIEWSSDGGQRWKTAEGPIEVSETTDVLARAILRGDTSVTVRHRILKVDHHWMLDLEHPANNQYSAGGDQALIDGIEGGTDFRTGEWQGFWGEPCVATLDLGEVQSVARVVLGALQDIKPWIWTPRQVRFYASTDGVEFKEVAVVPSSVAEDDTEVQTAHFVCDVPVRARYLRVEAEAHGPIPEWHLGRGNDRWMFLDEISVELTP
jgi:hypothetical protein